MIVLHSAWRNVHHFQRIGHATYFSVHVILIDFPIAICFADWTLNIRMYHIFGIAIISWNIFKFRSIFSTITFKYKLLMALQLSDFPI